MSLQLPSYRSEVSFYYNGDRIPNGGSGCGETTLVDPSSFTLGEWYFWAVTKQGAILRLYVNGMVRRTVDLGCSPNPYVKAGIWMLGAQLDGGSIWAPWHGKIDDVSFYSEALNPVEIQRLYTSDLDTGLVLYLPLDGNARDFSPYGNDGMIVGGPPQYIDNFPVGLAGNFVPADSWHIEVPHAPQLVLSNSFSVHFWYKTDFLQRSTRILQKHFPAQPVYGRTWDIAHDPADTINFYYCWPGSPNNFQPVCPIKPATGRWQQVVFTYTLSENLFRAYVDGALVASQSASHQVVPLDSPLSLLLMHDRAGSPSGGSVDEVRIYNRDLSASEVRSLFNFSKPAMLSQTKAVRLNFFNLVTGGYYQLQFSPDLRNWTNVGNPITATSPSLSSDYFQLADWSGFWRLEKLP
jgi:hypothetical protein